MLLRLLKGECPCCSFADLGPKTRLSYHYALLERTGLVTMRKEGVAKYLSLRTEDIERKFPGLLTSVLEGAREEQSKSRSRSKLSER
jgi:DNA-binding transcriptional ArsR family regulator